MAREVPSNNKTMPCPSCGKSGKRVSTVTLAALLRDEVARDFSGGEYACCHSDAKNVTQLLVLHFRQGRVHHQDEADGDRDVGRPDLESVDQPLHAWQELTGSDPGSHRQKNPERQETVQKSQLARGHHGDWFVSWPVGP